MQSVQAFLIDQFILEVGEGRMPREGSPERTAYMTWSQVVVGQVGEGRMPREDSPERVAEAEQAEAAAEAEARATAVMTLGYPL